MEVVWLGVCVPLFCRALLLRVWPLTTRIALSEACWGLEQSAAAFEHDSQAPGLHQPWEVYSL